MKNLPRLPLEIWLMILKIKRWTDRKNILENFHKRRKNIFLYKSEEIDIFDDEESEDLQNFTNLADLHGWRKTYEFNGRTYNFCTLYCPDAYNANLFVEAVLRNENSFDNWYCKNGRSSLYGVPIYYYFEIFVEE